MTHEERESYTWHYGPTATDPDPGKMWHYSCGGEVLYLGDGYICRCGQQWDDGGEPIPDTPLTSTDIHNPPHHVGGSVNEEVSDGAR